MELFLNDIGTFEQLKKSMIKNGFEDFDNDDLHTLYENASYLVNEDNKMIIKTYGFDYANLCEYINAMLEDF